MRLYEHQNLTKGHFTRTSTTSKEKKNFSKIYLAPTWDTCTTRLMILALSVLFLSTMTHKSMTLTSDIEKLKAPSSHHGERIPILIILLLSMLFLSFPQGADRPRETALYHNTSCDVNTWIKFDHPISTVVVFLSWFAPRKSQCKL